MVCVSVVNFQEHQMSIVWTACIILALCGTTLGASYEQRCATDCYDCYDCSTCVVDCAVAISDACETYETVFNNAVALAVAAFHDTNGSRQAFESVLRSNSSLRGYVSNREQQCHNTSRQAEGEAIQHQIMCSVFICLGVLMLWI